MSFPEAIDPRRFRFERPAMPSVRLSMPQPSRMRIVLATVILLLVIAGSWLLVRNSSLVAVQQVKVVGLSGYYEKDARSAVVSEAMQMTTMNFDSAKIEEAAAQFVDVAGVHVETDFPHGAVIRVDVRRPVVVARLNGRTVTLSQTGEVIAAPQSIAGLPHIEASGSVTGNRVTGGKALEAATLLGAAPDVLLRKVDKVRWGKFGIVVELEKGVDLYFGDGADARRKWRDVAAVLASSSSRGAAYIDLRVAGRPAIGGLGGAPLAKSTAVSADATGADAATATDSTATDTATPTSSAPQQAAPTQTQTGAQAPAQTQQQTPASAGGAGPNG